MPSPRHASPPGSSHLEGSWNRSPPCQEASRGRRQAASHGGKTRMSGCSWTAIVVAPGDGVQGELRTLAVGTQDTHTAQLCSELRPEPCPARVEWEGWSDCPWCSPEQGPAPQLGPEPLARDKHNPGTTLGRPGTGAPAPVLPVAQPLLYISWLFFRHTRGCRSGSGGCPEGSHTPPSHNHFCPSGPLPTALQAKAWPGFYLPVEFSSSPLPFCA